MIDVSQVTIVGPLSAYEQDLLLALVARISELDLEKTVEQFATMNEVADRMMATVPDLVVDDPPVGWCFTAAALARWRQQSTQTVSRDYRARRVFGFKLGNRVVFPAIQFDPHGQQSREFKHLFPMEDATRWRALDFALWLRTATPDGDAPITLLGGGSRFRTTTSHGGGSFVPTVAEPPGDDGSGDDRGRQP